MLGRYRYAPLAAKPPIAAEAHSIPSVPAINLTTAKALNCGARRGCRCISDIEGREAAAKEFKIAEALRVIIALRGRTTTTVIGWNHVVVVVVREDRARRAR